MLVRELMAEALTAGPDWPVRRAAALISEPGRPPAPVVEGGGRLLGMVSEVDLIRDDIEADPRGQQRPLSGEQAALPRTVDEVMTREVFALLAGSDVNEAVALMVREKVRSLPVLDADRVVGIISRSDVLRLLVLDSETIRTEVVRRISDVTGETVDVAVDDGVVTLAAGSSDRVIELASLVARTVPGVLRVRR